MEEFRSLSASPKDLLEISLCGLLALQLYGVTFYTFLNLPNLPRVLNKKEADITPRVIEWFAKNYPRSVALEVKIKGNKVLPHQEIALKQVQGGTFSYKLPDTGRRNPFDAFVLKNADAFVVECSGWRCTGYSQDGRILDIHLK